MSATVRLIVKGWAVSVLEPMMEPGAVLPPDDLLSDEVEAGRRTLVAALTKRPNDLLLTLTPGNWQAVMDALNHESNVEDERAGFEDAEMASYCRRSSDGLTKIVFRCLAAVRKAGWTNA